MSSYDKFAKQYSKSMSEKGDYFHQTQIDPCVYSIIGNPKGKTIYDIGCGNGYMARNLARKGAEVFASDVSPELIKIAKDKSKGLDITYSVRDGIDFRGFGREKFDVVVMNMVIHYIDDLDKLFSGIFKVLKPHGVLVFSTNHFFRSTYPYSDWSKDYFVKMKGSNWIKDAEYLKKHKGVGAREVLFVKVTNYLKDYSVKITSWWDDKTRLTIRNRPLNVFVNTMSKHNLFIDKLHEPESPEFPKNQPKKLRRSHHIPTFIVFGVRKIV